MNVSDAARRFKVSEARVRALLRQGRIPGARKVFRDWVLPTNPKITKASYGPKLRRHT